MSGKVSGWVWDSDLPQHLKFVLLAYADRADHNGRDVYPSIDLVCQMTGHNRRHVQRLTRELEGLGWLIPDGKGPRGTNRYRIPLHVAVDQPAVEGGGLETTPGGGLESTGGRPGDPQGGGLETTQGAAWGPPEPSSNRPEEEPSSEPSKDSSPVQKRPPKSEYNRLRKVAEDLFAELTKHSPPADARAAGKRWWRPLVEILDTVEWDERSLDLLMRATFLRMEGLTYDAPDQWVRTARSIWGEIQRGTYRPPGSTQAMDILRSYYQQSKSREATDVPHH